jgi:photosystem II stability/assembly factor-like uncharacterized protein
MRLLFTIIFTFCLAITSNAQWISPYNIFYQWGEFPYLNSVDFSDSLVGHSCGQVNSGVQPNVIRSGIIIKTIDGGDTWDTLLTSSYDSFSKIIVESNTIFSFGGTIANQVDTGIVVRSLDDGINWDSTYFSGYIIDASFPSDSIGYLITNGKNVHKTSDMGTSWSLLNFPSASYLSDCFFLNDTTGFISTADSVYKTIDGGYTWLSVIVPFQNTYSFFRGTFFINDTVGFVTGDVPEPNNISVTCLYKTIDQGNSWAFIDTIKFDYQTVENYANSTKNFWFTNENDGIICAKHFILKTNNGGVSWSVEDAILIDATSTEVYFDEFFTDDLMDIQFISDTIGFIVGANQFYRTNTFGDTTCLETQSFQEIEICSGDSIFVFNEYLHFSGTYIDTLFSNNGCDSIWETSITVKNMSFGSESRTSCDSYFWASDNFTYTTSGTYTALLINVANCDSIATLNLTITNNTSGTDIQTACDSLVWIDGNTYTSSNSAATHTLTNAVGCDSVVTLNLTINTVNPSVTQSGALLTADEIGATYQWLDCSGMTPISGATNQSYTANGDYAVIVTNNGCSDTSACYTVTGVGFIENDFGNVLLLFPNPTNGSFSIDLGEVYQAVTITITNLNGKLIQSKTYNESQLMNLKLEQPTGVYLLKIESGNKKAIIRLIKE